MKAERKVYSRAGKMVEMMVCLKVEWMVAPMVGLSENLMEYSLVLLKD